MKGIVLYRSKSGFVKKYAELISKELDFDLREAKIIGIKDVLEYDVIIYGGGVYISGINGVKFITKNIDQLKDKELIIFASGATPERETDINNIITNNFTEKQLEKIKFFYMRGGFDASKLSIIDKFLMSLLKFKLKHKKNLSGDERGMLKAYEKPIDFTSKRNAMELLEYVKNLKK